MATRSASAERRRPRGRRPGRGRWRSRARRRRTDRRRAPRTAPAGRAIAARRRGVASARRVRSAPTCSTSAWPNTSRAATPSRCRCFHRCRRALAVVAVVPPRDGVERRSSTRSSQRLGAQPVGVGEPLDEVGVGHEHVAEVPARAEQEGEVPGDLGRVAEGDGQRGGALLARRQPAEAEEAEVRIRRGRQPVEEQREQLLHHPRRAGEATGELGDGLAGALHVGEAEGLEPLGGGQLAQRSRAGERRQQGAEPHPLVHRAHRAPGARPARGRRPRSARPPACPGSPARARPAAGARDRPGTAWVWRSSSSCSTCSTRRRNR